MLLVSSMMNNAVWGHEEICADFQENNKYVSHCFRYPMKHLPHNYSLECKSAFIGMFSPESCESGICKFKEWLLYIGLAKLFDLTLNLAALLLAALDYGRYVYGSQLPLLEADTNSFYRTIGNTKLGLIITSAAICMVIPLYFCSQFDPVAWELLYKGCLTHVSSKAFAIGRDIAVCNYFQIACPLMLAIQDLAYRHYKATQGQRYMRLPTQIEPSASFIIRRSQAHIMQLMVYISILMLWGFIWSVVGLLAWGDSINDVRSLDESATTQDVGDWCFYCPGEKPRAQLGAHVAVQYIAWFLVILTAMAVPSIIVATCWIARCKF